MARSSVLNASSPPADAPIATMGKVAEDACSAETLPFACGLLPRCFFFFEPLGMNAFRKNCAQYWNDFERLDLLRKELD
jgi:hypothetical protein